MRKCMLCCGVALLAPMSQAEDLTVVGTPKTAMVVRLDGDVWRLVHYGAKADAASLAELELPYNYGLNSQGFRKSSLLTAFGMPCVRRKDAEQIVTTGGLSVQHADGVLTTDLMADGTETSRMEDGAVRTVFRWRDRTHPFFVTQSFTAFADTDVIECEMAIRHAEKGPVRLMRMDTLAVFLQYPADEYHVQTLASAWGCEGRIRERRLERGSALSIGSRSGVRGAWEANPSFMLSVGKRADETSGEVIGGVLAWSGAWAIDFELDHLGGLDIHGGAATPGGYYTLDPGRALELPKAALVWSDRGKGEVSRQFHRWARRHRLPHGAKERPVVLNSWESTYFDIDEGKLAAMMDGAKEMGVETFVLDDGWFGEGDCARNNGSAGLGDWKVNRRKLPHGLEGLRTAARSRGLDFGLWIEPEMADVKSELYAAHPDWILREPSRPVNVGRGLAQVVLDFANPAVTDNIRAQLKEVFAGLPSLSYVKWDANANVMNPGCPSLPADRQANFWFDYTQGLYSLARWMRTAYPRLDIQACASGGGRMEYGFLAFADEFWASDDTDARERVFIQWGASQFYPANAIAAHVTECPNGSTGRMLPLKFRFDVAMSARLGLELRPWKLTADEVAFAKRAVADYKRIRPVVQQGDLYRLVSPYDHDYAALQYVSEDRARAVVFVWGLERPCRGELPAPIRLPGLDPRKAYAVEEINCGNRNHCAAVGKSVSGEALQSMGLPVVLKGDYDSAVFRLETSQEGE